MDSPASCPICFVAHPEGKHVTFEQVKKTYFMLVFAACGQRKKAAARVLGLNYSTFIRTLERYS